MEWPLYWSWQRWIRGTHQLVGLAGFMASGEVAATTDMGTAPNANSGDRQPRGLEGFWFPRHTPHDGCGQASRQGLLWQGPDYSYFSGGPPAANRHSRKRSAIPTTMMALPPASPLTAGLHFTPIFSGTTRFSKNVLSRHRRRKVSSTLETNTWRIERSLLGRETRFRPPMRQQRH